MNTTYRRSLWGVLLALLLLAVVALPSLAAIDDPEPEMATLRALKYNDLNANGERNDNEPYLEGWTINVYDESGLLVDSKMTDVNGTAEWQVPAGIYTVCELLQSDWVNTQAGHLLPGTAVNGEACSQEQLLEPGADWTFLFGNYELARLRVLKYNDLNMDGQRQNFGDTPEGGLADWVFNVYDAQGALVDSKSTGPNGYYTWKVAPGAYTVCEVLQQHWVNTQAGDLTPGVPGTADEICSQEQVLLPGELVQFDFGNYEAASLRVLKYNDLNMDGQRQNFGDNPEVGLADWTFNVYDAQGALVDSQTTGPNGYYTWQVPAGLYTVCEILEQHWVNTQAGDLLPGVAGLTDEVCAQEQELLPGELYEFAFGNYELPRLRVLKYNDLNMDGQRQNFGDNPEVGLADWTFNVYDDQGVLVDSQTTGPNGYYTWRVPVGAYTACELLQQHWVNTQAGDLTPGTPQDTIEVCSQEQTLLPGELYEFAFGNYELPQLRVLKYNDLNMDGQRQNFGDNPEVGLAGWTFNVYDEQGAPVDSQLTGPNGYYTWRVPVGKYTACELQQDLWVNTQAGDLLPGVAGGTDEICAQEQELLPGELIELAFGNYQQTRLRVFKYNDLNMDGVRQNYGDNPEGVLPGWTFNVYDSEGVLVDSQQNGPNGYYTWRVPSGAYTVCELQQEGWVNTQAGDLTPGVAGTANEVCAQEQVLLPGELYKFAFGNYELPPASFCPVEDPAVGYAITNLLGVGMGSDRRAVRSRNLIVPDYEDVTALYGQLAATEVGRIRFVRFRYPDKSYVKIKDPTSPAYQDFVIKWWGADLDPAHKIKGQFRWIRDGRRSPRAFVLWPTYETSEQYANVFTVFDDSTKYHVFWDDSPGATYLWHPEQTFTLALPETQEDGADILVKIALVDNNRDNRPIILTVSAGGVIVERIIYGPNARETLNLEEFLLENVPAGTNEVVIHMLSPDPSIEYPKGGDSSAIIGAAASYSCLENGIVTPEPTAVIKGH